MTNTFEDLLDFIQNRMRMAHIYQPVMLQTLLDNDGEATQEEIAKSLLSYDQAQIDYYENITSNMVGKVLRGHGYVTKSRTRPYALADHETLTADQIEQLHAACQVRLDEYIKARGDKIWQHRKMASGVISGTIRYEVLKNAKNKCELCGISSEVKALEVDHIQPRSKGGSDDISNFQALCYSCNAMKSNRDDTDFRGIPASYEHREAGCLFCEIPQDRVMAENELAYAIRDGYPVTEGHTLVIPKKHEKSYFELGRPELNACTMLLDELKKELMDGDGSISGFNIGINDGESAGQTIFHCHIHLIPRRDGDVETPRGGVRHIIPGKGDYG
jgi:diadenosine tetraphosphate (Ap4A) HIT family hydrolase/5-methylcytosine-specific restriction endonuclease McrA